MGVVYRGEDPLIGREVAIKTLTEVTPEIRDRFYLEARSSILSHPNIVTVYELGEQDGIPFIAMELVAGESLELILRTRKRLPLLEALSIVEQLCAGLGHAHGHGVVHRDVKPANVLLRPDGRLTIVDFGIVRLGDQKRQLIETDALLKTFHYVAPERLKRETSDGRADIWSVGVILYEMLTGELPFKGKDVSSLYRVIHEPYIPLAEFVAELPEGLAQIVNRSLEKQVKDRYATAEEMSFELQVIVETLKQERAKERRQHLLDRLGVEIPKSLYRDDLIRSDDQITRAVDLLPGETVLRGPGAEMDRRKRETERNEIVGTALWRSHELFAEDPAGALNIVEAGLAEVGDNAALLQTRQRLLSHLQEISRSELSQGNRDRR
jgi:serine/threonine protein kinase